MASRFPGLPEQRPMPYGALSRGDTGEAGLALAGANGSGSGMFGALPSFMQQGTKPLADPSAMTIAPVQANTPNVRPSFFGQGGTGRRILGALGEAGLAMSASAGDPYSLLMLQNRFRMQQQAAEDAHDRLRENRPQLFNAGDGQILSVNPGTMQVSELHGARPAEPKISEQQSLIDYWNTLPENDPRRPMIERSVRGYQYSQPYIDQRQDDASRLEEQRQRNRETLRAQPTYGNLHPRSGGSQAHGQDNYEYRVIDGKLMRRRLG